MLCLFRIIFKTYESYIFCNRLPRAAELVKVVEIDLNFNINMSDFAKKKRLDSKTVHILDLPEQIFRRIFIYLDDDAIFSLKKICNKIKSYVDGYVELERRFLVLYNDRYERRFAMESMHMIKFPAKNPRIRAKMTQSSLSISNPPSSFAKHAFATTIQQYNVIVLYYSHENQLTHQFESKTFTRLAIYDICSQSPMNHMF